MAGHSQFKNIMHRKGRVDAVRSKVFSKLAREITVSAKLGLPDPAMNPRLRAAILAARAENMPKDNIERAIKKAQGGDAETYDEIRYEGYGPGGAALIVEAMTDNRNRTASDIRSSFTKNGGNLAETGAVVVHCPLVVGRGGRRLRRIGELKERGVAIGLGTDTAPPDMLMNLQIGVALARTDPDGPAFGPADYLRAATLGGAAALGRPDLGRLEPGAGGDVAVWDLSDLAAQPVHDPVQSLFLMPPGRRAREVFVAGRQVVRDFKVVSVDESVLALDLQSAFETLRRAYGERDRQGRDWSSLFPSTFPIHAVEPADRTLHRERTG